jgi:uncharacterized protein
MSYQWSPKKAAINRRKHGVSFAEAVIVFLDDRAITMEDEDSIEERFVVIGSDSVGRILVVIYTYRGTDIRIISARKATAEERSYYEGAG